MVFHCCCQKNTEWFRGEFCGLLGMQILGKCASCGSSLPSPWHCQLCSVPARTAGTQSQAAADPCCSQTTPWVLSQPQGWEPPGLPLLLWEAEVGRQQRWSAQTGSSWNCVRICHAAGFRPFTPCVVVSDEESATILVHPAAESTSPNPSTNCASAEVLPLHFSFSLLWKQSAISSSQMWWVL